MDSRKTLRSSKVTDDVQNVSDSKLAVVSQSSELPQLLWF